MYKNAKNILIVGATSGIGKGLALEYLKQNCAVALTGRRIDLLKDIKQQNPTKVFIYQNDITQPGAGNVIETAAKDMGRLDCIIICAGVGDINLNLDAARELQTVKTNALGFTEFAVCAYKYLDKASRNQDKKVSLAGISSIASFRGGWASPSYYASKAFVSNYLEGLRVKAFKENKNITVTTIIPGFVDTALAKGVGGEGLFWVAPVPKAARQIVAALQNKKEIVYITKRWRLIAWVLKFAPAWLYKRVV